jgi:putative polymerase
MQLTISNPSNIKVEDDKAYLSNFAIILLFTAFLHHLALCFINTNIFQVSTSALVLTELSLLGVTSVFFIRNIQLNYLIILIFVIANTFLLAMFQGGFDPKNVRNFMIPILMIWLGSQYDNRIPVDILVKWLAWIFLLFGLFELFFSDFFQQLFNVVKFQYAVGRSAVEELEFGNGSTFSANGMRYHGRNFLAFLGEHRVASVFLETVNTSNFSTLLVAWGLSKKTIKDGWQFYAIGLTVALLADSRFGMTLITMMTILRFCISTNILKIIAYFFPIFVLIVCFYFGWNYTEFRDDFETRLGSTGYHILNFKLSEFFGLYGNHYKAFVDQGYARLLHFNGIILMIILWISTCRLKVNKNGVIFKCLILVIISSNLAISGDSMFAFKWVTIMWFLLGTTLINNSILVEKIDTK